jgi:diadenylate cyclase
MELYIQAFIGLRLFDVIDILLVALLLFELYNLVKGTGAINIFIGIVAVIILWKLVNALEMSLLSEILGAFISVGFIALIVVFQPEIRQFLLLLGNPNTFMQEKRRRFFFWRVATSNDESLNFDVIIKACQRMVATRTGALLIIAKSNELKLYANTGEQLDAGLSELLIETIFFKNSPLHDGAVIIVNNRISAARCILPVSESNKISTELGLRHRSAIGITERTDSLAIVVSEERGEISFSKEGSITLNIKPSQLKTLLEQEFMK